MISLSCFTRPLPKTVRIESTKASDAPLISHEAMLRMGYNMKMIPKQKSDRTKEISEIESIQRELVKNDIFIPNQTLQKAILYDNERDTSPKKLGQKMENGMPVDLPEPEFEVKYPGPGSLLLVNPFAKEKKASKKKKKK